jgi:hypothetical protein
LPCGKNITITVITDVLAVEAIAMAHELEIDGRELLAMSEEAPDQVEAILTMMIEAEEEFVFEDQDDES